LFVRKTRAVHLTPAGQQLQPTLSEAFLQIRQIVDQVRPKAAPTLRISSTNALISKWLLPRLHRFTSDHPEVQVHIDSHQSLGEGAEPVADIEIRYANAPPKDMHVELLHRELMLVVASPEVLDTYNVTSAEDLWNAPILHDTHFVHAGSISSWELWAQHAGSPDVIDLSKAVRFERPPGGQIVDAAIAGVGIAICGSLLTHSALADGRLICPFGPILESERDYYMCCSRGRESEPHIRDFLSWARREAAVVSTLQAMREASDRPSLPGKEG
jgi:LysR family glycine cleavage system transcriptional activator